MFAPTISSRKSIQQACDALLEADRLTAEAISIISHADVEASTGLSPEMLLVLSARRTGADARMLVNAAAMLRDMPVTAAAFARGDLSWGQIRAIVAGVRTVDIEGRSRIDELVARESHRLHKME